MNMLHTDVPAADSGGGQRRWVFPSAGGTKPWLDRARLRSWLGGAVSTVALLATLASPIAPARAALTSVGAVDPVSTFPSWFQDASALRLGPCIDPALCFPGSTP